MKQRDEHTAVAHAIKDTHDRKTNKLWSFWTIDEHLDAAGRLFEKHRNDQVNGLHKDLIEATAHTMAAQAIAQRSQP